jgi:hypothetical protein
MKDSLQHYRHLGKQEEQKEEVRRHLKPTPAERDIENILGIKTVSGKKLYLVKWVGCSV